ncbi:MAG: hypothetical protein DMG27_06685 [Acidobacteria bacterium]|nr:MAG: hypothetical protein DMG27_06685 [Acidobacteriota bacterium]
MNMRIANLACVLVAFCAATTVLGQTLERGEISGTVYDPNHAVVPRAEVTLSSPSTGFERTVPSDDSGSYVFTQVPAGEYQITVTAGGFAATRVTSVELHVGDSLTMDITLTIQGQTQTVEVTAEPEVLAGAAEGVSQLISAESVANLPLSGRDYRDLAQLSPSAEVVPGLRGGIRLGGQQSDYTGLVIDGGDTTNNFFGEFFGSLETKNFTIPLDAVQEFQVVTNGFAPEFGRSTGGLLNVITKSGANQVHGSAHYYYRGKDLTSNDALGFAPNIDRQQQFGGALGFPLVRDKQFLFLAVDRQAQHGPLITKFGQDVHGVSVGPPYNIGDLSQLEGPHQQHQNLFSGLVHYDYQITPAEHFSARSFFTRNDTDGFTGGNGQNETAHAFDDTEHFDNQGVNTVFTLNSIFGASKVNEVKLLISAEKRSRHPNGDTPAVFIGDTGVFGQEFFLPSNNDNAKLQAQDNFNYVFGKHDIKFGGDVDTFRDSKDIFVGWSRGEYFFNTLADFKNNNPFEFVQGFALNDQDIFKANTLDPNYQTGLGLYWQDKWQASPRLTVTYGARFDQTWNPQPQSGIPGQEVYVGVGPIGPHGSHLVKPPQGVPNDHEQIGPRIGMAYSFGSNRSTVLRAAWGLYYAQTPPIFFPTLGGSKAGTLFCFPNPTFPCLPPNGFPNLFPSSLPISVDQLCSYTAVAIGCPSVIYVDPDFKNPRVSNLTAGVEHRLGNDWTLSANYVYVHSSRLRTGGFSTTFWSRNVTVDHYDQFGRAILVPFTPVDPTISFFGNYETASFSHGNYHEAVIGIQRRLAKRYQFFANYTLASNKDNASSERDTDTFFGPQDPFRLGLDYGRNALDVRNQFKAAGVVDLPSGFALSGLVTAHTGYAYPAYDAVDANNDAVINQFANNDRPIVTENGKSFLLPRYPARQPGFFQTDFRVNKIFRFNERYRVELLADFFNLFNTANLFSNPDVNGYVADQLTRFPKPGDVSPTGTFYRKFDQIAPGSTPFAVQFGARFDF